MGADCCNGATESELKAYQKQMMDKDKDDVKSRRLRPISTGRNAQQLRKTLSNELFDEQQSRERHSTAIKANQSKLNSDLLFKAARILKFLNAIATLKFTNTKVSHASPRSMRLSPVSQNQRLAGRQSARCPQTRLCSSAKTHIKHNPKIEKKGRQARSEASNKVTTSSLGR